MQVSQLGTFSFNGLLPHSPIIKNKLLLLVLNVFAARELSRGYVRGVPVQAL